MLKLVVDSWYLFAPLAICSLVIVAVVIDRFWALRQAMQNNMETIDRLEPLAIAGDWDRVLAEAQKASGPLARVIARGLENKHADEGDLEKYWADECIREIDELGTRIDILMTLFQLAPLFGLLGTVTGMISAFQALERSEGLVQGGDVLLAKGIKEALYTTAFGLAAALPALFFHDVLVRRRDRVLHLMEDFLNFLLRQGSAEHAT